MSSGIAFTPDSARRIANATRGYEQEQGAPEPVTYQADGSYGRMMLVQTASTLPANYTGLMAVQANIVEKLPNNTVNVISNVWVKDLNNQLLSANTIYNARLCGEWTQNIIVNGIVTPTTYGLYVVQNAQTPSIAEPFKVMSVSGGFTFIQTIDGTKSGKFAGSIWTPEIWANIFNQFRPTVYGVAVFQPTIQFALFYPFTLQVDAYYYGSYSTGDTVTCAAPGGQSFFSAHDPLQLMRANGYRGRAIISYGTNSFGSVSYYPNGSSPFTVIAARQTDNFTTGGIGSGIGSGISGV